MGQGNSEKSKNLILEWEFLGISSAGNMDHKAFVRRRSGAYLTDFSQCRHCSFELPEFSLREWLSAVWAAKSFTVGKMLRIQFKAPITSATGNLEGDVHMRSLLQQKSKMLKAALRAGTSEDGGWHKANKTTPSL